MTSWDCVLKLNEQREVVGGSVESFAAAVKRGADIRGYTTFDYAEHMDVPGSKEGLVQEMMSFGTVYWLEGGHVAGIQTTRYPANCSLGFLDCAPSLSFFLNNESAYNGVARPHFEKREPVSGDELMSVRKGKFRPIDFWDAGTSSPCVNFTYDFGQYGWCVNDGWQEILAHDADGAAVRGSLESLQDAFRSGKSLKVGVNNLCAGLAAEGETPIEHEVFVELHSVYNHQDSGFLGGESHPIVRVAPGVPLRYTSGNWNFGWILPRTDGIVHQLVIDPHTREFTRAEDRFAVRWLVR